MAAGDRTAVFRAIGDFTRLVRDAKRAKASMKDLGDESAETGEKLGDTKKSADETGDSFEDANKKANRFARTVRGLSQALQGPQKLLQRLQGTKAHEIFERMTRAGDRLGGTLKGIRNKLAVFSLMALGATAAVGPVMGLVGAVGALSGAVGVLPAVMGAMAAANAVLKVAFMDVQDVLKTIAGPAEAFEESIKELPPPMQEAARAARTLVPGLRSIKKEIQGRFWDGLAKPIQQLGDTWFPIARAQGGKLASTFNKMAKEAANFLTQQENVDDWDHSLHNVNRGWEAMIKVVRPLLRVLTDVFAVSSEFLPDMGKGVAGATQKFSDFVRQARESGQLKQWIANGIEAVKDLGSVLKNVGRIFGAVFDAGKAAGAGFLETLKRVTDQFADFLESREGQRVLTTVFEQIGRAVEAVMPILKTLASAVADVLPIFVAIGERIAPGVVKLINGLRDALVQAKPTLLAFGSAIGDLLSAIGEMGPLLGEIVEGLVWAATPLGWLADAIRFLADMFDKLPQPMKDATGLIIGIGVAALVATGLIGKLGKMAAGVLGTFGKFIGLLNKIPGLNIPVPGQKKAAPGAPAAPAAPATTTVPVPDVDKPAKAAGEKAGKSFLSRMGAVIKRGGKGIASAIGSVFSGGKAAAAKATSGIGTALSWVKSGTAALIRGIGTAIGALAVAFRALGSALLANPIVIVIAAIAAAAYLIISNWETVQGWLKAFWEWLKGVFADGLKFVTDIWNAAWAGISSVASTVWEAIKTAVSAAINFVASVISTVLNGIRAAWDAVWGAIKTAAEWVWNGIKSTIETVINIIRTIIETTIGIIRDIWDSGWKLVSDIVTRVWDTIKSVVGGAADVVKGAVQGLIDIIGWLWDKAEKAFSWIVSKTQDAIRLAKELIGLNTTAQPVPGSYKNPNSKKKPQFGRGGLVGGRGNRDDKLILAKSTEYVSPPETTKRWLPLLRALNPYDRGGLEMGSVLSNMVQSPDPAPVNMSVTQVAGTAAGGGGQQVRDVHVTQIVHNPLPEKPSETASKRTGRAARLGVMSAIGGVA